MSAHDCGYRQIFSYPDMVKDLLTGFVKGKWVDALDFDTLERRADSYVSDDLREREDDIIWRVKWRNKRRWMYIYLLIEFQTKHDPFMAVRIMNYVSALYQDLIKIDDIKSGEMLPPVLPMVVYRGDTRWNSPTNVKYLVQTPPPGLARYVPSLRFLVLEETSMNDEELEEMTNMAAALFRIEKSETLKASIKPLLSLLQWTQRAGAQQDSLKRSIFAWYHRAQMPAKIINEDDDVFDMTLEEIEPMLSERVEQWSKELREQGKAEGITEGMLKGITEGRAEGKAEGITEGMLKGRIDLFFSLYQAKFGSVPEAMANYVLNATAEDIRRLSERLITADSPGDLLSLCK